MIILSQEDIDLLLETFEKEYNEGMKEDTIMLNFFEFMKKKGLKNNSKIEFEYKEFEKELKICEEKFVSMQIERLKEDIKKSIITTFKIIDYVCTPTIKEITESLNENSNKIVFEDEQFNITLFYDYNIKNFIEKIEYNSELMNSIIEKHNNNVDEILKVLFENIFFVFKRYVLFLEKYKKVFNFNFELEKNNFSLVFKLKD